MSKHGVGAVSARASVPRRQGGATWGATPDRLQIVNWKLAAELSRRREFTFVELDQWGVPNEGLTPEHYVVSGGRRYQPRGRDWRSPPRERPPLELEE